MIELLFTACLSAAPAQCQQQSLTFSDLSPRACMIGALPELARWRETHPAYEVTRWTCKVRKPGQYDI